MTRQIFSDSPFEEEQIRVVVLPREEVAEDPGGVSGADLDRREPEVDALDEVEELRRRVLRERPANNEP